MTTSTGGSAAHDPSTPGDEGPRTRWFLPALLIGWALMAFGAWSALRNAGEANPSALAVHLVAFDLAHDVVVAPLLFAGAWLMGRVLPPVARGPVRAAGAVSALAVVFSVPLLTRWGQRPTNSSTLPLDYGRNLLVVIVTVWLVAGVLTLVRVVRSRRT